MQDTSGDNQKCDYIVFSSKRDGFFWTESKYVADFKTAAEAERLARNIPGGFVFAFPTDLPLEITFHPGKFKRDKDRKHIFLRSRDKRNRWRGHRPSRRKMVEDDK